MSHGFVQLPPDGTGKRLHTVVNTVEANAVHNQIICLGDPNVAENKQYVDNEGQAYMRFAEGAPLFDAFGKMKVSQETHLANLLSFRDRRDCCGFADKSGTASDISHNPTACAMVFTTDTEATDYARWTTDKRFYYVVGTGMYILSTVSIGDTGKDNSIRRWGYFDNDNGLYFELDGTNLRCVIRSNTSGTAVDTAVDRADWNIDKLDGTGLSEFDIDITKINIYWIDFQWLGAGRVRFGVVDEEGKRVTCHEFRNANSHPNLYMATANLPFRVEQLNDGQTGSLSQMRFYNMGVIADGNYELPYVQRSGAMPSLLPAPATTMPVWSLKVKATHQGKANQGVILPAFLEVYAAADAPVLAQLVKNGTLTGATWGYDLGANSIGVGDVTATAISGGEPVFSTVIAPGTSARCDLNDIFRYEMNNEFLKIKANGESDYYTLTVRSLGATVNCYPLMTWKELVV